MILYRYEDRLEYKYEYDEDGYAIGGNEPSFTIRLLEFEVVRETTYGYWINGHSIQRGGKFVLKIDPKSRAKRFAYPNKIQAAWSYKIRKNYQLERAHRDLARAEWGIEQATNMIKELMP